MSADQSPRIRYLSVGDGKPLVLLHGFGMKPETYLPLARILAEHARVIIPAIFELEGPWTSRRALTQIRTMLDDLNLEQFSLLGHSFGGGLELGLACEIKDRVVECVFADTLGVKERFGLAQEAMRYPGRILAMATPPAVSAFARSITGHPAQMLEAALWGFASDREPYIHMVAAARIPCHVLWASRDSLLCRSDGQQFARQLNATFTVATGRRVDHDWMFDDPELFAQHLFRLHLKALS